MNFCPGYGGEIGDHLVTDARTRFISFTGSVETGLRINELAARQISEQRWIKGVLRDGGKDAMIIDCSADLEAAADDIMKSTYGYAGQKCSAAFRVILHRVLSWIICRPVASRNGSRETKRLCPMI